MRKAKKQKQAKKNTNQIKQRKITSKLRNKEKANKHVRLGNDAF